MGDKTGVIQGSPAAESPPARADDGGGGVGGRGGREEESGLVHGSGEGETELSGAERSVHGE